MSDDFPIIQDIDAFFSQHDYGLSEDQQKLIREKLDKGVGVVEIAREIFDDPNVVARSEKYNTIRKFCDKLKRGCETVFLDENAQRYIRKNAAIHRPLDMARVLFGDPNLKNLSKECKTIEKFVKILGLGFSMGEGEVREYKVPKTDSKIIEKINNADPSANFKEGSLNGAQTKMVANLKSFLGNSRFLSLMNSIYDEGERALFENEFVATAYNKMDMTAEDLQACITLAYHYLLEKRIQNHLIILDAELMESVQDKDASLKMTLTEAYGKKSDELDKCVKRIQSLQKSLSKNRADRLTAMADANKSLTSMVEMWKEEETRKRMLLIAKATELAVDSEMKRLENEESFIASIYGISQDEISDGM